MCGIAGFVSLNGAPAPIRRVWRRWSRRSIIAVLMIAACSPTAPAALGAARLSIIDVAGGHQPISVDGGGITVAQNGEIYNYVELRRGARERGGRTATACDTEVIAHLYAAEGVARVQAHARHVRRRHLGRAASASGPRARSRRQEAAVLLPPSQRARCSARRPRRSSQRSTRRRRFMRRRCCDFLTFGYVAGARRHLRGHASARARHGA